MAKETIDYNKPSKWVKKELPHTIYYYYAEPIGEDPPGQVKYAVRVYIWVNPDDDPIRPREMKGIVARLTSNARDNGNDPRPIGTGFTVPWWRKSYLVVALDDENGFEPRQAVLIKRDGTDDNHSFFDGGDETIKDTKGRDISIMWTVNYMKGKDGNDIPPNQAHKFSLQFKGKDKQRTPLIPDDSGTNMGPPVPPPA